MDKDKAIDIINTMINCLNYEWCNEDNCAKCIFAVSNEDQIKALTIAIAALKKS